MQQPEKTILTSIPSPHVSQFAELRRSVEFGSVHTSGRMFESREEYIEEFGKIDSRTRGVVKLNRGLEVDFSPRFLDSVGDFVNRAEMSREKPEHEA